MKKILMGIVAVIFVLGCIMIFLTFKDQKENEQGNDYTPNTYTGNVQQNIPSQNQNQNNTHEVDDVQRAFQEQVNAPLPITLGGTYVVINYAIQNWTDGYSGGEILLKKNDQQKWEIVTGDSYWYVDNLTSIGVPRQIAEELLRQRDAD